jgi:hypothetical protein
MKVLLNACYGGYSLSDEFIEHLKTFDNYEDDFARHDPFLIEEAIKFGLNKASGMCADLYIKEIPDNIKYSIYEYDGMEYINETWIEVSLEELKNGLPDHKLNLVKDITCIRLY